MLIGIGVTEGNTSMHRHDKILQYFSVRFADGLVMLPNFKVTGCKRRRHVMAYMHLVMLAASAHISGGQHL